jgi:hypothetical protein
MALPTYLELVNDILIRLREPTVTTVQENILSKLVGKLINDSKRQVEDSYAWNSLSSTQILNTVSGTNLYSLTGIGTRFKVSEVKDMTNKSPLVLQSSLLMSQYLLNDTNPATPMYYNFKGVDSNGDTKVELYPVPNAAVAIYFNITLPQNELSADADVMYAPKEPVVLGAFARALVERGEDGGLNSSEAYGLYKASLADAIAIESSRYVEEETWEAV